MGKKEKVLSKILKKVYSSVYAKRLNIHPHISFEEYKSKVPIIDYKDIREFVMRAYNGEKNIFSSEKIIAWGTTSGTTSEPKLIPFTKNFINIYKKARKRFLLKVLRKFPGVLKGKILFLGGKYTNWKSPIGLNVGSVSGYFIGNMPNLLKKFMVIDQIELDKIKDAERFDYIANKAVKRNITLIGSSSATYILGFLRAVEKLVKKDKIKNLWPNLKLICYPCGGHYGDFQIEEIKSIFPNVPMWDSGLGATEGYFASPLGSQEAIWIPNSDLYLIELLPLNKKTEETTTIEQAKIGKKYEIVISSINGLLRYRMGDIVSLIYAKGRRMMKYHGRIYPQISVAGERLTEIQLIDAFKEAIKKTNLKPNNFFIVSPYEKKKDKFYVVIIEQSKDSKKIKIFGKIMEESLQKMNINYQNSRLLVNELRPIKVVPVSKIKYNKLKSSVQKYSLFQGQGKMKFVYKPNDAFYKKLITAQK